jgi:hypothetical protein
VTGANDASRRPRRRIATGVGPEPGPYTPQAHRPRYPGVVNRPARRRIRARFATAQWNRHSASTWASRRSRNWRHPWTVLRYPITGSTEHCRRRYRRRPAFVRRYRRMRSFRDNVFGIRPRGAVTVRHSRCLSFSGGMAADTCRSAHPSRFFSLHYPASANTPRGVRPVVSPA